MVSLTAIAGCAATPASDDDSAEGVGESQDHLLAGRRLSETEAASLIRQAGFPESSVGKMICTIKYESNFYERASNRNTNGSVDYGLFQVNSTHLGGAGCPSSSAGLYTAATNTKCALAIYKSQGINAWYGYQKHRTECNSYPAPSGTASTPAPSTSTSSSSGGADDSSSPDDGSEGGCYSGTLEDTVPAKTCVESKFAPGGWFQCKDGKWYAGGEGGSGPDGACSSSHPLN
jgi:lysozyme C